MTLNTPFTLRIEYVNAVAGSVTVRLDGPPTYITFAGAAPPYTANATGDIFEVSAVLKNPISIIEIEITNTCGRKATKTDTLRVDNRPPVFTQGLPPDLGVIGIGSSLSLSTVAMDPDPSDNIALSWTFTANPANAGVFSTAPSGLQSDAVFTASTSFVGNATLSATVTDPQGASVASSSIIQVVNQLPRVDQVQAPTQSYRHTSFGLTAKASDSEGSALQYFWTFDGGTSSIPAGQWTSLDKGNVTTGNTLAPVTVTLKVRDSLLAESPVTTLTIPVINRAPALELSNLDGGAVKLGATKTLTAVASDSDGDPVRLAWSVVDGSGSITSDGGPTATFTAGSAFGNSVINVVATDSFDASVSTTSPIAVGAWRVLGDAGFSASQALWIQLAFDDANTAWVAYDTAFAIDGGALAVQSFRADAGWLDAAPPVVNAPRGIALDIQAGVLVLGVVTQTYDIVVYRYDGAWTELVGPPGPGQRAGLSQAQLSLTRGPSGPVVAYRNRLTPTVISRTWNGTDWANFPASNGANVVGSDGWKVNIVRDFSGAWLLGMETLPPVGQSKDTVVVTLTNPSSAWTSSSAFSPAASGIADSALTTGNSGSYFAYPTGSTLPVFKNVPGTQAWTQVGDAVTFPLSSTFVPSMALADDGTRPWLTGYSTAGLEVLLYNSTRARWETFGRQGRGAGSTATPAAPIAIDKTGAPCVALYDAPQGGLTVQCLE